MTFATTNTLTTNRTIDITLGNAIAFGGRFYEVVTNKVTATAARTAATGRSLFGIPGYLVNITSAAENQFILSKVSTLSSFLPLSSLFSLPSLFFIYFSHSVNVSFSLSHE